MQLTKSDCIWPATDEKHKSDEPKDHCNSLHLNIGQFSEMEDNQEPGDQDQDSWDNKGCYRCPQNPIWLERIPSNIRT